MDEIYDVIVLGTGLKVRVVGIRRNRGLGRYMV